MILYLCFLSMLCFLNSASELCFDSTCQDSFQTVRFPFRITNQQPRSCGYPGFDLTCNPTGQPLLHLPFSGDFSVQFIDYQSQEIWLNDPNNCLPSKILSLNLNGSPFEAKNSVDLTFFNCSWNDPMPYKFNLNPISCLSVSGKYAVFGSSSWIWNGALSATCREMMTVSVPESFSPESRNDLRLVWRNPDCRACESRGGRKCGLKFNSTNEVQCTYTNQRGMSRGARYAVSIGVGVPAIMCFLGFLCCLCARVRSYSRGRNSSIEAHWVISSQPITLGLDGPTINSYPKVVLGQSLRLPKPNDNICSICLSEYQPKETVKSIPECQHFFHQDCIDEWLRLNASCPVCRKTPIESPPLDSL